MKVHPFAAMFPMLAPAQFEALKADVAANGLRSRVVVDLDGYILDGRNRRMVCIELGIEDVPKVLDLPANNLLAWVVSKNLHRRHLTARQRAAIAAEFANLKVGRPPAKGDGNSALVPNITQEQAARALNVSTKYVGRLNRLLINARDLHERVKHGELHVHEAEAALVDRQEASGVVTPEEAAAKREQRAKVLARADRREEARVAVESMRAGEVPEPEPKKPEPIIEKLWPIKMLANPTLPTTEKEARKLADEIRNDLMRMFRKYQPKKDGGDES